MELSLSRSLPGGESLSFGQYFCSISKTVSSPDFALVDARSRLAVAPNLAACSAFIRPSLDGFEGNGTLTRSG